MARASGGPQGAMATRESDEQILDWIHLWEQRVPLAQIALKYGKSPQNIENTIHKIRKADREEHEKG